MDVSLKVFLIELEKMKRNRLIFLSLYVMLKELPFNKLSKFQKRYMGKC